VKKIETVPQLTKPSLLCHFKQKQLGYDDDGTESPLDTPEMQKKTETKTAKAPLVSIWKQQR